MRAVVTGGAGFVGSNLCRALLARGTEVVAVDNLITGDRANVADLVPRAGFSMVEHDVTQPIPVEGPLDAVLHFASPASPPAYLALPLETLAVGSDGTRNALDLARERGARFVLASTSEVYGDPLEHPQRETYYGNVNPIGPRSVYDEAKRFAEAITIAYHRSLGVDVRLVRIFNTYGPGLAPRDGRVVSNFMVQAMRGESLTVHGDGTQTRSFCFVDDLVRGVLALLDVEAPASRVVNIGNPDELTVLELAKLTLEIVGSTSDVVFQPPYPDDPTQRRPDITLATQMLGWTPVVELRDGLGRLHEWYRSSGVADA